MNDCHGRDYLRHSSYSQAPFALQLYCNCTSIAPFGLPGPATLQGVIGCASACVCVCICPLGLLGTPPEACCCGGGAGGVSGLFGRSSRGIASEICRLWVPAAGGQLVPLGQGQGLPLQTTHSQTPGRRRCRWK